MADAVAIIESAAAGKTPARADEIAPGMAAMDALRSIASALREGRPVSFKLVAWFSDAVAKYGAEAQNGVSLCGALGIAPRQAERPWWLDMALRQRDDALRAHARLIAAGQSTRAAALIIRSALLRYESTRWRLDRTLPIEAIPQERRQLAYALKSGAKVPGLRQLQSILAGAATL